MADLKQWQRALLAVPTDVPMTMPDMLAASGLNIGNVSPVLSDVTLHHPNTVITRERVPGAGRTCYRYRRIVSDDAVRGAASLHALVKAVLHG